MGADEAKQGSGCGCGSGGCCGGSGGGRKPVTGAIRFLAFVAIVAAAAFLVVKGLAKP